MKIKETPRRCSAVGITCEFRENYLFLRELIQCRERNDLALQGLESITAEQKSELAKILNRRQNKIVNDILKRVSDDFEDGPAPVPPELEASIRVRRRSTWLPWEAEAIEKIERWRRDVLAIRTCLPGKLSRSSG
jgi:hypothetical protein